MEINAVNSFVTNLDGYALHPSGMQTVTGEKKDILFYLGYIGEIEKEDMRIILPLNYLNNSKASQKIDRLLSGFENPTIIATYKNFFIGYYDGPYLDDFRKTETTMISYQELITLINNWLDSVNAGEKQRDAVDEYITLLETMWDDSLAEKLENPDYSDAKEVNAVSGLISALSDVWLIYTFNVPSEEIAALDTMIIIPYSYCSVVGMYIFENGIIATEGSVAK